MRNRAILALTTLAFVAMSLAGAADAQRLIKSEPASGARDVDPNVGVIRLHFDCDMVTDSFTVVDAKEGPFPPVTGDNSRPWKSPRLFVLSIGKLEIGKTYALQLNSPTRSGFQSVDRKPLPVTVVTFTVGRRVGPGAIAPKDKLVGIWDVRTDIMNETFVFTANGQYQRTLSKGEVKNVSTGMWRLEGETLIMRSNGGGAEMRHPIRFEGRDRLIMIRTLGKKTFHCGFNRRSGGGGRGPADARDMAGLWQTRDKGMTYAIQADGNYTLEIREKGDVARFAGRWRIEGEILVFTDAAKNHAERRFKWSRSAPNTIRIYFDAKDSFEVHRIGKFKKPDPPRGPGGLVGTWLARDADGSAKIVFAANGRYTREFVSDGQAERSGGTWRIEGTNIVARDDKEGETLQIPFTFPDRDTLRLTIEGDTIQLRRQGARVDRPGALVGQWAAKDQSGSIALTLGADGRHRMAMRNPQQQVDFQGEWRVEGQTLVVVNEANGRELRMPFQAAPGGLMIDLQGTKIQLKKVR